MQTQGDTAISPEEQRELSDCNSFTLMDFVRRKVYELISQKRQSTNCPDLYVDTLSENVANDKMFTPGDSREQIMQLIDRCGVACSEFDYVENEMAFPDVIVQEGANINAYKNYMQLAETTLTGAWPRIVANNSITHVGLATRKEGTKYKLGLLVTKRYFPAVTIPQ